MGLGNKRTKLEKLKADYHESFIESIKIGASVEERAEIEENRRMRANRFEVELAVLKEEERLRVIEQKKYLQSRECVNPNCTK